MKISEKHLPVSKRSLKSLLQNSLTSSLCVSIPKNTELWVATGMLVYCLESFTDSLIVRDNHRPVGFIAGRAVMENLIQNPTSEFLDKTKVEDIMEKEILIVTPQTTLGDLLQNWMKTRRAFAIIENEFWDYSCISARKILEIGARCKTQRTISDFPKKTVVTFKKDDSIGDIINSMLENKTRKLLLENSSQFVNDRLIFEKITEELQYLHGVDNFLDLPIDHQDLPHAQVISQNLNIPEISKMMYGLLNPYVIFKGQVISPWDICVSLLWEDLTEYG